MSDKQRMTHPDVPDQEIFVRPESVPVHEKAGWVVDDSDDEGAPAPVVEPPVIKNPAPLGSGQTPQES